MRPESTEAWPAIFVQLPFLFADTPRRTQPRTHWTSLVARLQELEPELEQQPEAPETLALTKQRMRPSAMRMLQVPSESYQSSEEFWLRDVRDQDKGS